jgi:hypothetical protein
MCFSITASLAAGGFLLGVGVVTVKAARRPSEIPFAAIPLLFAIQQLSEGVVWWTFSHDVPGLNFVMTQFYSFFSHVLWPAYVPLAVLLLEPPGRRSRLLKLTVIAGIGVGLYLLYSMFEYPITSRPTGGHVEYESPHFFAAVTMTGYLLATTVSPLLSKEGIVKIFGAFALISFVLAYLIFARWFISVWCFFAAILSVIVAFRFFGRKNPLPLA